MKVLFFTGNYLLGNKGAHMYNGNAFICKECRKTYKTRRGLQNHSCLKCHSCIKTFSTKQLLERHKCKSNDTFRCEKCLTSYSSLQRLTTHKCKYCPQCRNICSSFQCRMSHKCSATNRDDHFKCVKDEVEDKTRTWNECEKETIPQYPKKQSKNTHINPLINHLMLVEIITYNMKPDMNTMNIITKAEMKMSSSSKQRIIKRQEMMLTNQ